MINKQPTQYDNKASLIIKEDMKEIFNSLTI